MYIARFNEVFRTTLPNEGIYNLDQVDGKEILQLMKQKIPLCDYCIHNEISWKSCGDTPAIDDFAEED